MVVTTDSVIAVKQTRLQTWSLLEYTQQSIVKCLVICYSSLYIYKDHLVIIETCHNIVH